MSKKKTPQARKTSLRPEQQVRIRIICQQPLPAKKYKAVYGLQDNSTTAEWVIDSGKPQKNGDLHFECECRVRENASTGNPNFLGRYVHGAPAQRFLYLSWRPAAWRPGDADPPPPGWVRRLKVHLSQISWQQIDEAAKRQGVLEGTVLGTSDDGGPSCASQPLLGRGWTVKKK